MVGKTPRARAVPQLEELEPREVPSASGGTTEAFDGTAAGKLPASWSQWSTNGSPVFAVSSARAQSTPNGLAATAGASSVAGRTWLGATQPGDVQVSASIYLSTLIPAQVFARGSNLGTAAPSYYALSVTRGLHLQLLRVLNGKATVLGSVDSAGYVSGQWVRTTLSVSGGSLQVQLRRLDTGQYLTASGKWQDGATSALNATDTALAGPGLAGLARQASYTGTVVFDDFAVAPLGSASPTASLTRPTIPQHYSWIRLAELAYSGTPMDSTTDQLLKNSIDLVVPNAAYLSHINSVAPSTPQLIYTNFSSLYEELLTDWLSYADAHGTSREDAFYHVSAATPFSGNSASSQPVDWFWSVQRGSGSSWTNYTSQARGTAGGGVAFGGSGQSVAIGYPDEFREINLKMTTPAANGWTGVLEYPTAVDANGNPTAWRTLTLRSDGTAHLTQSGQIAFDPPPDWVPANINGSARLYYVRFRTTAGGTAPVAATILGRDYVNANGGTSGTIPAFDYAADTNHDGYLSDAEYAHRAAGKDARFVYESRLFVPGYGQMRFATNPSNAHFQAWAADYAQRLLQSQPLADGLFVDNSSGKAPVAAGTVLESVSSYGGDYGALLHAVSTAVAPHWLLANTSGGQTNADPVLEGAAGGFEEFALRPLSGNWQTFDDLAALVAHREALTSPAPYLVLDSLPNGGSPTDPRTQMATLAEYYLLADPTSTFLDFYGGFAPSTSWTQHGVAAVAYDVGQPVGGWSVAVSGPDPTNAALTYKVLQRRYTNALVLYKPLSYAHNTNGTLADATATTYTPGGSWRVLQADGTLGAVVTSVTLCNGEGAILIPVSAG